MGNNTTKVVTGVLGDSYNFKEAPYMETKETGKENQEKIPTSIPAFPPRMGREGNLKGAGYSG